MLSRPREQDRLGSKAGASDSAEAFAGNGEARYLERVGNAYRVTDKVNIPDLSKKLSRRIDMIIETARELSALDKQKESNPPERSSEPDHPSGGI